ncbi:MAG: hypothetical protein LH609_13470 [Rudanella sp.]|nr:hypothetical protein [Rudanella sp.]
MISKDGHIYPAEYSLIADDLSAMGGHANDILKDMRQGTSQNMFEMNDQGRIEWIFRAYESAKKFQGLVNNYYYKVRSLSLRRIRSQKDWQMTAPAARQPPVCYGRTHADEAGQLWGSAVHAG